MEPRLVTVNDLYAFDPKAVVTTDPFLDIVGRHFKQPKEGLGYDNSPVAHMWRTIAHPDSPCRRFSSCSFARFVDQVFALRGRGAGLL